MLWLEPIQLLGYASTFANLWAMALLARSQIRTSFQWALCIGSNLGWIAWGIIQDQPAVVVDGLTTGLIVVAGFIQFRKMKFGSNAFSCRSASDQDT